MGGHKDDLAALNSRIDELRERVKKLEITPPSDSRPASWLHRVVERARVHRLASILISATFLITVTLGGAWFGHFLEHRNDGFNDAVDGRIKATLAARGGVIETLTNIQKTADETRTTLKTLQPFIEDIITHQFESVSKLPNQTLARRLPAVGNLIAAARDRKVKVATTTVSALSAKLASVPQTSPSFWPVAAQLINYRSDLLNGETAMPKNNCYQAPHMWNLVMENCVMRIDGKELSSITFIHCIIKYSGGTVYLNDVKFEDSVFILTSPPSPSPDPSGQRLERALLTADLSHFSIKSIS